MNKKFFTLLAAAAFLLGSTVPASAAVPNTNTLFGQAVGADAKGLVKGENAGLYHIANVTPNGATVNGVLYVENTTGTTAGEVKIDNPLTSTRLLGESLWCVTIDVEAQGKNPSFSFLNKAYGDNLRAEEKAVANYVLDGPLADWNFSKVYGKDVTLDKPQPLYSYINGSEAIVLVQGATSADVKTVVAKVTDIEAAIAAGSTTLGTETLLYFVLKEAAPRVLTADDFNTKLGTERAAKGQKLVFAPDKNVGSNPFSENVLSAVDVVGGTAGNADWYLNLKKGNQFLRVDTSLVNATGSYFLTFKFTDKIENNTPATPNNVNLEDQYAFRFVYFPTHDSLIINVKKALQPSKTLESKNPSISKFWQIAGLTPGPGNQGHLQSADDVYADALLEDFTYVILQDLNDNKVVTIGELPSQTRISLGLGGCKAAVNKTSAEGLFVIKNAAGKYLQVPIYTDTVAPVAKWVTLEKHVDPFQMPSFQWVVEKVRSNDTENTSQIKITNREYADVSAGTVQLWKDKTTEILDAEVNGTVKLNVSEWDNFAESFIEVPKAQREDPYLGYKYVSEDVAKLRTYTFNYLHELGQDTYLSVKNSDKDSLLYVQKDNADGFELVPYHHSYDATKGWSVKPVNYGTQPADWTKSKYAAQLVRSAYVLKIKEGSKIFNTNKIVVVDKEGRYAVTPGDKNAIAAGDSAVFYLKTNNTVVTEDGAVRNYYALVDTASFSNVNTPDRITVKGGVADHNLWLKVQNHYEVRTSAFAVEPNEEPLYRRFNRAKDGVANGATNFYNDVDSAYLHLRFHRVNNENEFLYEDANSNYSKGKGINFLGYKHKADFGLADDAFEARTAFRVDTAFVNRPATAGAEFDTPKPQYLIGLGINDVEAQIYTPECDCEPTTSTPAYSRGRYLINATDSVYGGKPSFDTNGKITSAVKNADYIWDTKWERLAFVEGIRKGDTLYILNGAGVDYTGALTDGDFAKLRADKRVSAIYLGNNLHKDVVFSFRLINTEKDAAYADQVQDFLIESETTQRGEQPMIAPMTGGWVKLQNGVPVISRGFFEQAITDAERFNVVATTAAAVANEDVNIEAGVQVSAEAGAVRVQNAAGKTVTISNILGQTVVSQTIASDDVTIAAPKGIVVVSVAGEKAVKAIVK